MDFVTYDGPLRYVLSTDCHLNFLDAKGVAAFADKIGKLDPDGVFLTGDIAEGTNLVKYLEFLQKALHRPIYFVCGNHDYYMSSVESVRKQLEALNQRHDGFYYLRKNAVALTNDTWLVGVDGWADAQFGFAERGRIQLADWTYIKEYKDVQAEWVISARITTARRLAKDEASWLNVQFKQVPETAKRVIVLTHIPPFREATWHEGKLSDDDWVPWFSCQATGEVLKQVALDRPNTQFEVYCGHTHSSGEYQALPNLLVETKGARYSHPAIAKVIDVL